MTTSSPIAIQALNLEKVVYASSIIKLEVVNTSFDGVPTATPTVTYRDTAGLAQPRIQVDQSTYRQLKELQRQELEKLNRAADAHA